MNTWWIALGLTIALGFMIFYFAEAPTAMPPLKKDRKTHQDTYAQSAINDYGEPASTGKVKEPVCFWSALAFIAVGLGVFLWMDLSTPVEPRSLMSVPSAYSIPLAALMVWLGPGSMCEHGTLLKTWGFFDSASVHWLLIYVFAYLMLRLLVDRRHLTKAGVVLVFYGVCGLSGFLVALATWSSDGARFPFIVGLMVLVGFLLLFLGIGKQFGSPYVLRREWKWLIWTASLAFTGIGLQLAAGPLYEGGHILYFHAVWHVHIALATLFLFRYLRTETILDPATPSP